MRKFSLKFWIVAVVGLGASLAGARAWEIPYYRMDSLALLSGVVVLAEEQEVRFDRIEHENWVETRTVARCKADRVFKGDWKAGAEFTITYGPAFERRRISGRSTEYLPAGRALLFLKRDDNGAYNVVSAKLIQGDKVLTFGQFLDNPGPQMLAEQKPENIAAEKYGEAELIEDLRLALEKAAALREPVSMTARQALSGK